MTTVQDAKGYRSGFVTIVGRPNVGKSTLLNAILGERIAITTAKPQTTRQRILGVHHFDDGQIVYLDTPGIHRAKGGLNKYMMETAMGTIADADLIYFMIEAGPKFINRSDLGEGNRKIMQTIARSGKPAFLIINKVDLVEKSDLLPYIDRIKGEIEFAEIFPISAKKKDGIQYLVNATLARIPEGPPYYPGDMITDRTMRFLASEIVREKTMILLQEELPYSTGVSIEQFKELGDGNRYHIEAVIYVERNSQKGIVIGKGASMLKNIGKKARVDLERFLDKPVGLKLFIKVKKDWTENPRSLKELGYE